MAERVNDEIQGNVSGWSLDDVNKIETEPVQIRDPGVGKEVILRHFFFKAPPLPPGERRPNKLELINQFKRLIETNLWGDGLIIREDKPIEVHTRQKAKQVSKSLYMKMQQEGADFVILVLAEPRMAQVVHDKPHIAQ